MKLELESLESRLTPSGYSPGPETLLGPGYAPAVTPDGAALWMQPSPTNGWDVVSAAGVVAAGQEFPALTPTDTGFILATSAPDPVGPTWAVDVLALDGGLVPTGAPARIDGDVAGYMPTPLAVTQGSGTVSVFYEGVWDGSATPQWGRDLDASLSPIGSPYEHARPAVPPLPVTAVVTGGQVLVTTPDGTYVPNTLPADPLYGTSVAVGSDGTFTVGWTAADAGGAYARTYTPDGQAQAAQLPVTYTVGPDGRVWSSLLQATVTNDRVKQVLVCGQQLFAVGLDDRVWVLSLDSTGHAVGGYTLTGTARVLSLVSSRLVDGDAGLVVTGLDGRLWGRGFDGSSGWALLS